MATKALTISESEYLPLSLDDSGGDSWQYILRENLGGDTPSVFDLPAIKIPPAGGQMWMVPTLEGPDARKAIECVIVHWQQTRAYWKTAYGEGGTASPPDCSSKDGAEGEGEPGGDCATCQFNEFGSGKNNSKACKEVRQLYIIKPGDIVPTRIPLAPMSIAPMKQFMLALLYEKKLHYSKAVISLELQQKQNKGGITYSAANFKFVRALNEDERAFVDEYRQQVAPMLQAIVTVDRTEVDGPEPE